MGGGGGGARKDNLSYWKFQCSILPEAERSDLALQGSGGAGGQHPQTSPESKLHLNPHIFYNLGSTRTRFASHKEVKLAWATLPALKHAT